MIVVAGCRTSNPGAAKPAAAAAAEPVTPALPAKPRLEPATAAPATISGFDLEGPVTCLPLAAGEACLVRKDSVADACAKVKGEILKCGDCSVLCTKAVP